MLLYENKISAQIQEITYPPQWKPSPKNMVNGENLKALVSKVSTLQWRLSSRDYRDFHLR